MNVSIITTPEDLLKVEYEWRVLYENCDERTPFLSFDWVLSTVNCFLLNESLTIFIVKNKKNEIVATLPLVIERKKIFFGEVKVLKHLCSRASDFSGVLISSDCCQRDIIKRITQKFSSLDFDLIHIDNLSSSSKKSNLLIKFIFEDEYLIGKYINVVNPILDFDENHYEDKKQSKDIERRLKKLSQEHSVEIHIGKRVNESAWDKLVEFHYQSFPNKGFNTKEYQGFYKSLMNINSFKEEFVEFSYMLIDDEMVAGHFGFKDRKHGHIYYYVPSYNETYYKYGVGKILLKNIIEHYKNEGFSRFDFLRGAEAYKKIWMTDELQNYSILGCKKTSKLIVKIYSASWLIAKQIKEFIG